MKTIGWTLLAILLLPLMFLCELTRVLLLGNKANPEHLDDL